MTACSVVGGSGFFCVMPCQAVLVAFGVEKRGAYEAKSNVLAALVNEEVCWGVLEFYETGVIWQNN